MAIIVGRVVETDAQLRWLVSLRWVALGGIIIAAAVLPRLLPQGYPGAFGWVVAGSAIGVTNLLFTLARRIPALCTRGGLTALLHSLILVDIGILTYLIHYGGSLENPFLCFYVFHVIIAGLLMARWAAFVVAGLGTAMVTTTVALEHYGYLPHYHLPLYGDFEPLKSKMFVAGVLGALTVTLLVSAYFVTAVLDRVLGARARLAQQDKMASLGLIAAGVAHEIGNPLNSISSLAQWIQRKSAEPDTRSRTAKLLEQVRRISNVLTKISQLPRPKPSGSPTSDVGTVLEEAVSVVKLDGRAHKVAIEACPVSDGAKVPMAPDELLQVCVNLSLNALDAMPDGGRLRISAARHKDRLAISFKDTGVGMGAAQRARLFEPFFTTKGNGKGTGLGLAISYGIVKGAGGEIRVRSAPGRGSTFSIYLPLAEEHR